MKKLIIIGAGGQGRETAQIVKDINQKQNTWDLLGYIDDDPELKGRILNDFPVLGSVNDIHMNEYRNVSFITAIGEAQVRKNVLEQVEIKLNKPISFATLVHPTAVVGDGNYIAPGSTVCANTVITTNVRIGKHVIINYGSTVGHDTKIKDFCTILPGTNVSGSVTIQDRVNIGSGATILPDVEIGSCSVIGAGAVVTKNIPAHCTAVGIPAKPIKYHK